MKDVIRPQTAIAIPRNSFHIGFFLTCHRLFSSQANVHIWKHTFVYLVPFHQQPQFDLDTSLLQGSNYHDAPLPFGCIQGLLLPMQIHPPIICKQTSLFLYHSTYYFLILRSHSFDIKRSLSLFKYMDKHSYINHNLDLKQSTTYTWAPKKNPYFSSFELVSIRFTFGELSFTSVTIHSMHGNKHVGVSTGFFDVASEYMNLVLVN